MLAKQQSLMNSVSESKLGNLKVKSQITHANDLLAQNQRIMEDNSIAMLQVNHAKQKHELKQPTKRWTPPSTGKVTSNKNGEEADEITQQLGVLAALTRTQHSHSGSTT